MKTLRRTILAAAITLTAPTAFAEDAHHPAGAPSAASPVPTQQSDASGGGTMSGGMMHEGMMRMMMGIMAGGDRPMGGPIGQMMSPDHIEGRIAFLRTELKVTDEQEALWQALAEALRANAAAAKEMMAGMPGAMMPVDSSGPAPQRIERQERMLSTRLEGLRRLKAALEPFYAALEDTQKATADTLLVPAPMGMM